MKRFLPALIVIVSCTTGCMRVSTMITLKQDGSGTIDQEIGVNPQAFEGLAAMAGGGRGGSHEGFQDVFNEAKARQEAERMGVRFVSGSPIDTPTLKGYHAMYAFDDVKALKVRMEEAASAQGDQRTRDPFNFDFTKGPSSSTITIRIPQDAQQPPLAQLGAGTGNPEQAQQMLAMMKPMFAGMFVEVALAVDGKIIRTNAPFVQGSKVTLMQLDMNTLLASDTAFTKLQNASKPADLKNIPGLKVTTEPTVTIEFRR